MNIVRENIDDLNALVKIKLVPEDYSERVEKKLKDLRKKARIPGFRQGHVPMGIIKKMAGTSTLVEEINQLLSRSINDYISENKIKILGNPIPKTDEKIDFSLEGQKEFEFEFELGLAPNIDLNVLNKIKVEKYIIDIDNKLVDDQIRDLSRRYGKVSEVQKAGEDDMVYGKFEEIDKHGELVEGGISHESSWLISKIENKKVKASLNGIIPGSSIILKYDQFDSKNEKARLLGKRKEDLIFNKSPIKFTAEKIHHIDPAEVDQNLFDKIFGPGQVAGPEEFRKKVEEDLNLEFDRSTDQKLVLDIQERIIEKSRIGLPDEFLKKWLMKANENPLTMEQIESEYDMYSKSLKWQLIENKIIKEKNLEVNAEEAENYTAELLKQQFANYGQPPPEDDQLKQTAKGILTNKEEAKRIFDQLYDKKIVDFFKTDLRIREKKISYNEFLKLANK